MITSCFIAGGVWALAMASLYISTVLTRIAEALEESNRNRTDTNRVIKHYHHYTEEDDDKPHHVQFGKKFGPPKDDKE